MLDSGEVRFKKLSEYHLSDFDLGTNIRYFEIIENEKPSVIIARYGVEGEIEKHFSVYKPKKMKKYSWKFFSQQLRSVTYGMMVSYSSFRIRYVNEKGEEYIITKIYELKTFFDQIDTPAKLQAWLMMSGEEMGYSYRKSFENFIVRWDFGRINDTGMCTHYSYQGVVDKDGKIVKRFNTKDSELCSDSQRNRVLRQ